MYGETRKRNKSNIDFYTAECYISWSAVDRPIPNQKAESQMAKHKILLTRILTQTIELDVELPEERDCTDAVIMGAAVNESRAYFDTDWLTLGVKYTYELMSGNAKSIPLPEVMG